MAYLRSSKCPPVHIDRNCSVLTDQQTDIDKIKIRSVVHLTTLFVALSSVQSTASTSLNNVALLITYAVQAFSIETKHYKPGYDDSREMCLSWGPVVGGVVRVEEEERSCRCYARAADVF